MDSDENFDVIIGERGLYQDSVLNEFGCLTFKNGNYYIGQINNGKFHGRGLLVHPSDKKWTYGTYYHHELIEVIDSSVNYP